MYESTKTCLSIGTTFEKQEYHNMYESTLFSTKVGLPN